MSDGGSVSGSVSVMTKAVIYVGLWSGVLESLRVSVNAVPTDDADLVMLVQT